MPYSVRQLNNVQQSKRIFRCGLTERKEREKSALKRRVQDEEKRATSQMLDLLRNDVQACLARNGNRQSDAEATTLAIWSAWHGLAALLVRRRLQWIGSDRVNTLIDKVLEMSLEGVRVIINIDGNIPQVPQYQKYYLSHSTPQRR